ncbi:hypothetical protein AAHA92_30187 [Salvia divinorum]|uniref:Uncharacterized protein n=1 Tax=Salvia divinorum TaxID=28513 RepID=A0ABD1G0R5_SALDI
MWTKKYFLISSWFPFSLSSSLFLSLCSLLRHNYTVFSLQIFAGSRPSTELGYYFISDVRNPSFDLVLLGGKTPRQTPINQSPSHGPPITPIEAGGFGEREAATAASAIGEAISRSTLDFPVEDSLDEIGLGGTLGEGGRKEPDLQFEVFDPLVNGGVYLLRLGRGVLWSSSDGPACSTTVRVSLYIYIHTYNVSMS